jgi:protein TonB
LKYILYILIVLCAEVSLAQETGSAKEDSLIGMVCPEVMAEFPGGSIAMNKFIKENFTTPDPKAYNITGTCYVSFVVDTLGKIRDIKVVKGIKGCFECDEEAKRLISIMPNWKPSSINGKKQECKINYTVKFQMI